MFGQWLTRSSRRSKMQLTIKAHDHGTFQFSRPLPSPPSESEFGYELERTRTDTHQPAKCRRRIISMKKQRFPVTDTTQQSTESDGSRDAKPVLTPCHVCHIAPKVKTQLDAYEDCWRCQERTCYICMRECQAGCDRRKVCRQCCVEQGERGDVSCLDCLQHPSEDQEMEY